MLDKAFCSNVEPLEALPEAFPTKNRLHVYYYWTKVSLIAAFRVFLSSACVGHGESYKVNN